MRTQQNSVPNTTGAMVLSMLAGCAPAHRSLEAEAAELADLAERDNAARVAFQRRAGGGQFHG